MKKRILILIIILLLTTGCTCEYNLTIDGSTYKEQVTLLGETNEEISNFKNEWQIPIDKEDYNEAAGFDTETNANSNIYKYNITNSKLVFNYDFTSSNYEDSTAVSNCYNKLTVSHYNSTIIISTSSEANCFTKYPPLKNVKVNIKVDRPVISNNADSVNGNTYTWNINKSNAKNKSINIILDNSIITEEEPNDNDEKIDSNGINNYALYIFLAALVLIIFFGYKWFIKFKEKNNNID